MTAPRTAQVSRRQSGSALLVSLILLVVLTLIVISVIKSTTVNSRVAGNLQVEKESEAAAQQAIEAVITSAFQTAPAASSVVVDVNHDGSNRYTVAVKTPKCLNVTPIKVTQLDAADPGDAGCYASSSNPAPGVAGGDSLCSNTQWEIEATAAPTSGSGSQVVMHQGISVRVAAGTACP